MKGTHVEMGNSARARRMDQSEKEKRADGGMRYLGNSQSAKRGMCRKEYVKEDHEGDVATNPRRKWDAQLNESNLYPKIRADVGETGSAQSRQNNTRVSVVVSGDGTTKKKEPNAFIITTRGTQDIRCKREP